MKQVTLVLLLFLSHHLRCFAQSSYVGSGSYRLRNYPSSEYAAELQNWGIAQDSRGIIFVTNTAGLLEYDGTSWRLNKNEHLNDLRSLATDLEDRVYVGAYDNIGYFEPDTLGKLHFVSLRPHLEERHKKFGQVWSVGATTDGVFFKTDQYLFRLVQTDSGGRETPSWNTTIWETGVSSPKCFFVRDHLYLHVQNRGLLTLAGNSLEVLPGTERFSDFRNVVAILPYRDSGGPKTSSNEPGNDSKIIVVDRDQGLFVYDGISVTRFDSDIDGLILAGGISDAAILANDEIALSTFRFGVFIIDRSGSLKSVVDKQMGLLEDAVNATYLDAHHGLWLALSGGVSRVEIGSPLALYDERIGLQGRCRRLVRFENRFYVVSSEGLFYAESDILPNRRRSDGLGFSRNRFKPFPGMSMSSWFLLVFEKTLLVGTNNGVYAVEANHARRIYNKLAYILHRSTVDTNRVYAGTNEGLASLYRISNKTSEKAPDWVEEGVIEGTESQIRWIERDDNALWIGTAHRGIMRISNLFADSRSSTNLTELALAPKARIEVFDTTSGLAQMHWNRVFSVSGRPIFTSSERILRFDKAKHSFMPDSALEHIVPKGLGDVDRLVEDDLGNIWVLLATGVNNLVGVALRQDDNSYVWETRTAVRLRGDAPYNIIPERGGIIWFAGADGLIRYDSNAELMHAYTALVRHVTMKGDSTIFYGNVSYRRKRVDPLLPVFPYAMNAMRVEYAAPYFDAESATRFQYLLEGLDDTWSDWTEETKRDYTNLSEGRYQFRVRARNVYGHVSSEDLFAFEIRPPWSRSWWAYGLYAVLFGGFVIGLVRWRSYQLEKEKEDLERTVAERTVEIAAKTRQLEEQAEKLKELDHVKSRFFANISHEFRTPLTLIIDPLREMISGSYRGDTMPQLSVMLRNAHRLLRLINQLLDLSKLESGSMKLQARRENLVTILKNVVSSFESRATQKGINLLLHGDHDSVEGYLDRDKLEKVLFNLLSNAMKFTPSGGTIRVSVERKISAPPASGETADTIAEIRVSDTGIGVSQDFLPFVFDRFYQVDTSHTREHEGSGIGLALAKELVELHHGEIGVTSREGEGTEFIVRLPLGKDHLKDEEIVESPAVPGPSVSDDKGMLELAAIAEQARSDVRLASDPKDKDLILVIEDNADVRQYIRQQLAPAYEVLEASHGKEGLESALETIPDLIISDVMMPVMDGIELCSILKRDIRTSHIPVVLLTAKAEDADKISGLQIGADDYLIKPFNSQELLARIHNLIEYRKRIQEKYRRDFLIQPKEVEVESMNDSFLKKALQLVEKRMGDPEFTIEDFARGIAMSRVTLHRKLRALVNQSASEFIRSIRLKRAAQLLREDAANVTEIAFQTGFSSSAYFTQCFHEQFGCPPSEYRKRD